MFWYLIAFYHIKLWILWRKILSPQELERIWIFSLLKWCFIYYIMALITFHLQLWFLEFTYILLPMFLEFCTTVLLISEHSVIYWRNICKSTCKSLKICYFFKCLQNSCFNQQLDKWTYMNELMNCMYIYLTQSKVWTSLVSWACPIHK